MSKTLAPVGPLLVFATPNRDHDAKSGRKSEKIASWSRFGVVRFLPDDPFDSNFDLFDSMFFVWLSCWFVCSVPSLYKSRRSVTTIQRLLRSCDGSCYSTTWCHWSWGGGWCCFWRTNAECSYGGVILILDRAETTINYCISLVVLYTLLPSHFRCACPRLNFSVVGNWAPNRCETDKSDGLKQVSIGARSRLGQKK